MDELLSKNGKAGSSGLSCRFRRRRTGENNTAIFWPESGRAVFPWMGLMMVQLHHCEILSGRLTVVYPDYELGDNRPLAGNRDDSPPQIVVFGKYARAAASMQVTDCEL
jgi:hypothetical protein